MARFNDEAILKKAKHIQRKREDICLVNFSDNSLLHLGSKAFSPRNKPHLLCSCAADKYSTMEISNEPNIEKKIRIKGCMTSRKIIRSMENDSKNAD